MSSLPMPCSAPGIAVSGAVAGPSWWTRLARRISDECRARRAMRELHGLDGKMLRDIGLDPGGLPYAARFGRE